MPNVKCHCGHQHKNTTSACDTEKCKCQIAVTEAIPLRPVTSGNINAVGYSLLHRTLVIAFKSKMGELPKYFYNEVSSDLYNDFFKTFDNAEISTGSFAAKHFYKLPFYGLVKEVKIEQPR